MRLLLCILLAFSAEAVVTKKRLQASLKARLYEGINAGNRLSLLGGRTTSSGKDADDEECLLSNYGDPCPGSLPISYIPNSGYPCPGCQRYGKENVEGTVDGESELYNVCDPADKKDNAQRICTTPCSADNDYVSGRNWLCSDADGKGSDQKCDGGDGASTPIIEDTYSNDFNTASQVENIIVPMTPNYRVSAPPVMGLSPFLTMACLPCTDPSMAGKWCAPPPASSSTSSTDAATTTSPCKMTNNPNLANDVMICMPCATLAKTSRNPKNAGQFSGLYCITSPNAQGKPANSPNFHGICTMSNGRAFVDWDYVNVVASAAMTEGATYTAGSFTTQLADSSSVALQSGLRASALQPTACTHVLRALLKDIVMVVIIATAAALTGGAADAFLVAGEVAMDVSEDATVAVEMTANLSDEGTSAAIDTLDGVDVDPDEDSSPDHDEKENGDAEDIDEDETEDEAEEDSCECDTPALTEISRQPDLSGAANSAVDAAANSEMADSVDSQTVSTAASMNCTSLAAVLWANYRKKVIKKTAIAASKKAWSAASSDCPNAAKPNTLKLYRSLMKAYQKKLTACENSQMTTSEYVAVAALAHDEGTFASKTASKACGDVTASCTGCNDKEKGWIGKACKGLVKWTIKKSVAAVTKACPESKDDVCEKVCE